MLPSLYSLNSADGKYHRGAACLCGNFWEEVRKYDDGSISEKTLKKVQWYIASGLFMSELLSAFYKEKITAEKQKACVYLGVLIALNDVLVDTYKMPYDKMIALTGSFYRPRNGIEKWVRFFYDKLWNLLTPQKRALFQKLSEDGIFWQSESLKQLESSPEENLVHKITAQKGGISFLLFASIFDNYDSREEDMLFHLGAFVQYMNDAQDLFKDRCEGITTFVSYHHKTESVIDFLNIKWQECLGVIRHLKPLQQRDAFFIGFYFFLMFLGIKYKLSNYPKELDSDSINEYLAKNERKVPSVSMKSVKAACYILPRVLGFKL